MLITFTHFTTHHSISLTAYFPTLMDWWMVRNKISLGLI